MRAQLLNSFIELIKGTCLRGHSTNKMTIQYVYSIFTVQLKYSKHTVQYAHCTVCSLYSMLLYRMYTVNILYSMLTVQYVTVQYVYCKYSVLYTYCTVCFQCTVCFDALNLDLINSINYL